jgi:hypothetical protein
MLTAVQTWCRAKSWGGPAELFRDMQLQPVESAAGSGSGRQGNDVTISGTNRRASTSRRWSAATIAHNARGAAEIALTLLGAPLLRRRYNRWGATDEECAAPLPGDGLVPAPIIGYTRAITIAAPPQRVWPWLVQIGADRGGLYSFTGLENLAGCRITNTDQVLPQHQRLEAGDLIRLGPDGYPCFHVVEVAPPTTLVLAGADPRTGDLGELPAPSDRSTTAGTWQWHLAPIGSDSTRLTVRQRLTYPRSQAPIWLVTEPIAFVMEREMLRTIKRLAEAV